MKKIILLIFTIFYFLSAFPQKGTIRGIVQDSLSHEYIEFASVRLLNQSDGTFVAGNSTNSKGVFNINTSPGKYCIEVSFLGYKTYKRSFITTKEKPDYNTGIILLLNDSLLLDEAIVTAKVSDVIVKGDTIEYNADSYISEESELLQDIIKKLPGIEIDAEGNLKANGKPIQKILVDGKEFFGNDIKMALENLPANMIKKLQLFKEESETSKVTGFKDGKEQQVLNLKIKEEYKRNVFGDARIGYGNNDRYSNRLMGNYMHNENQFSIIGNMNNVNSNSGFGGGYQMMSGEDKNKDVGTNFAIQKSKDLKISGNIRYSDNTNIFETQSHTEYFNPSRISQQNSSSEDRRKNLNGGVYTQWKPDSLTTIYFRTSASYLRNRNTRNSQSMQYALDKDTTSGDSRSYTEKDSYNFTSSLVIGRKLNSKGRNISLSLNGRFSNEDSNGSNNSITTYTSGNDDLILDQRTTGDTKSNNWGVSLSYVEPITSKNSLMVSYAYRQNKSDQNRFTYNKDVNGDYLVLDRNYSRNNNDFSSTQSIGLSFQSIQEKYDYNFGINIDPSYTKTKVWLEDSIIDNQKQNVVNYSPFIRFSYRPDKNSSLNINYSGSTSHPGISLLSSDTIRNLSGTSKTYGNPDLKVSYNNSLSFYYNRSDYETGRSLMFSGSLSYTFNQVAYYTKVDSLWNTENTYKNVDGNWNTNFGATYNTPLKNKKFSIEVNSYVYYARRVGFSNEEKSITNNWNFSESAAVSYKSEKINSRLQVNYSYGLTRNNIKSNETPDISNFGLTNTTTLKLPLDITVQNDISYTYNSGYSSDFKKTELLWNASVLKKFLKKKQGQLKVQFCDILKDRSNVHRTVTEESISDMRTNSISRYFLVSFSYRFNVSLSGKKDVSDEFGDFYY